MNKKIELHIKTICRSLNFKKKGIYYVRPIGENMMATLLITTTDNSANGHLAINVAVGVSYLDVEKIRAALDERKYIFDSTIWTDLGFIMPGQKYKEWIFNENADIYPQFKEIKNGIISYAFPYIKRMSISENIYKAYEDRDPSIISPYRDSFLPIFCYLKRNKKNGIDAIIDGIKGLPNPSTDLDDYLVYAQNYLSLWQDISQEETKEIIHSALNIESTVKL